LEGELKKMTTDLIVRIKAPFTLLRQSAKRSDVYADVTNDYERGWKDADHFFWVVPDGNYRVRGNNCITDAIVDDGKVAFKAVGADKDKKEPEPTLEIPYEAPKDKLKYPTKPKAKTKKQ
jgi:hypothetical protein